MAQRDFSVAICKFASPTACHYQISKECQTRTNLPLPVMQQSPETFHSVPSLLHQLRTTRLEGPGFRSFFPQTFVYCTVSQCVSKVAPSTKGLNLEIPFPLRKKQVIIFIMVFNGKLHELNWIQVTKVEHFLGWTVYMAFSLLQIYCLHAHTVDAAI